MGTRTERLRPDSAQGARSHESPVVVAAVVVVAEPLPEGGSLELPSLLEDAELSELVVGMVTTGPFGATIWVDGGEVAAAAGELPGAAASGPPAGTAAFGTLATGSWPVEDALGTEAPAVLAELLDRPVAPGAEAVVAEEEGGPDGPAIRPTGAEAGRDAGAGDPISTEAIQAASKANARNATYSAGRRTTRRLEGAGADATAAVWVLGLVLTRSFSIRVRMTSCHRGGDSGRRPSQRRPDHRVKGQRHSASHSVDAEAC